MVLEVVNNSWRSNANGQAGLMSKIAVCRKTISNWKRQAKPNSAVRIQELHYKIDEAHDRRTTDWRNSKNSKRNWTRSIIMKSCSGWSRAA